MESDIIKYFIYNKDKIILIYKIMRAITSPMMTMKKK